MVYAHSRQHGRHCAPLALEERDPDMKVLIACHAGAGIGLGHLSRSLVIAKALRARFGADVRWLIQSDPLARDDLIAFKHRFVPLGHDLTEQIEAEAPVDLFLLDLQPHRVPPHLSRAISALRATGAKVVAIDGLLAYRPELDLIFMPSFQFTPPADLKEGAPIVFGWDCFLLDEQWAPSPWAPGQRVLALTGGSDATQLGATWPNLLNQSLPVGAQLDWVTGPFAAKPNWPATPRTKMIEYVAPTGLGPLMQQANYAITVFGVSFFELLYLGVPTVVFSPYNGKDNPELDEIAQAGVALVARDEVEATRLLLGLMNDEPLARRLSLRSRALLGQSGATRLCTEITGLIKH